MDLTDAQWELVAPLIPNPPRRKDGRGRPRRERREVIDGMLWILRTGAQWAELPGRYPPYQTCHRYFQQWCRDGTLKGLLHALAQDLYELGGIDTSEAFIIDGTLREQWIPIVNEVVSPIQEAIIGIGESASSTLRPVAARSRRPRSCDVTH